MITQLAPSPLKLIDEPRDDVCNVGVPLHDWKDLPLRPCRYKPKSVGESGRLLCSWHLNVEQHLLNDRDEWRGVMAEAAGLSDALAARGLSSYVHEHHGGGVTGACAARLPRSCSNSRLTMLDAYWRSSKFGAPREVCRRRRLSKL